MSNGDDRGGGPGTPRVVLALVGLGVLQSLLLVAFLLGWFRPPPPCDRPILLSGSGSAYSDFHDTRDEAERTARGRVQGRADSDARTAVSAFQCSAACPDKRGTSATADITHVNPSFGPPPGTDESRWFARADYNWFANVVCAR